MPLFRTGLALTALVALGGAAPAVSGNGAHNTAVVKVTAGKPTEFAFTLSKSSALPLSILFKVTNRGTLPHSFKVCTAPIESAPGNKCTGKATGAIVPGGSAALSISYTRSGTYEYLSGLSGQSAKGMKGLIGIGVALPKQTPSTPVTTTPKTTAPASTTPSPATPSTPLSGDSAAGSALFDNLGCSSCHAIAQVRAAGTVTAALNSTHSGGPFPNGPLSSSQIQQLAAFVNG